MWHPKQLLKEDIVSALLIGKLDPLYIEFLGWMSGTATALNRSRNPVKAAHTILARIGNAEEGTDKMWRKFKEKKMETIAPTEVESHEVADQELADLKTNIGEHVLYGRIAAEGMRDYSKGGVHNGDESDQEEQEEAAEAAASEGVDYV